MDAILQNTWEMMRAKIVHEDSWIQQRVSWLLAAAALFVAAYAALVAVDPNVSIPQTVLRGYLLLILPFAAFILTLLVFVGVIGSALAMRATLREWENLPISQVERSLMPSLHSRGLALSLGRVASWGICIMLLLAWGVLFGLAVVLV